jgi:GNAT superfamily N-acetyltransferase
MYNYVKSLGFKIRASAEQTPAGKYFWSKNRGTKRVWETTVTQDASPADTWIDKVYAQYPDWPYGQADKVMVWGKGEDQQFAAFKLKPGAAPNTVEIDWIMAGPEQRKGVGSRAIKELQRQAQESGIRLTLYPWAKGNVSQASLTRLYKRHGFKPIAKGAKPMAWEPVNEIARIPQGDFGDADTLRAPEYDVEKKPLPGGTGFTYAVDKTGTGDIEIMIFDGDTLAAELDLFETQDVTKAWRVKTVAVNPKYRSQGLGKALYGIALSILKLTIEAGDTQTRHGQRMWLMLNSIPGVEVLGYNMERTPEYKPNPNDKIISQDDTWTRYTFPVKPGTHSMRSGRHGTGMYTSQASMLAKWTGK